MNRVAAPRSLVSEKLLPLSKWTMELEPAFKAYPADKFTFIQGKATGLDAATRTVTVEKATGGTEAVHYYALIIATGGASPTPLLGYPGPHTIATEAIEAFRKKLPEAKSIVIAGGGPAGVETAGEIGHFLNGRAGYFSKRPSQPKAKITLVTNADRLLPVLRPALAKKAEILLNKVGVDVVYNAGVTSTSPEFAGRISPSGGSEDLLAPTKVTLSNDAVLEADLYIPAYGLTPNTSWVPANLKNEKGFVLANSETLRVDAAGPRVYVLGEAGAGAYGVGGLFELQMQAMPTVMINLKRDLLRDGKVAAAGGDEKAVPVTGKDKTFDKNAIGESQAVPVGRSTGVGAMFGWRFPGFLIWLIKGRQYLTELNNMNLHGKMVSEAKWKDL
jgi:apoptosis-inducing factor 2